MTIRVKKIGIKEKPRYKAAYYKKLLDIGNKALDQIYKMESESFNPEAKLYRRALRAKIELSHFVCDARILKNRAEEKDQ